MLPVIQDAKKRMKKSQHQMDYRMCHPQHINIAKAQTITSLSQRLYQQSGRHTVAIVKVFHSALRRRILFQNQQKPHEPLDPCKQYDESHETFQQLQRSVKTMSKILV